MSISRFLTQAECDALPVGAKVRVTWSGGNGPHEYYISQHWGGYACVDNAYHDPLNFVGKKPLTTVELISMTRLIPENATDIREAQGVEMIQEMPIAEVKRRWPDWSEERLRELADAESEALDATGGILACSPEIFAELVEAAKTDPNVYETLRRAGVSFATDGRQIMPTLRGRKGMGA